LKKCTSKFRYCTTNVKQSVYKVFTCPPYECPGGTAYRHEHSELNTPVYTKKDWDWMQNAYNCKIAISASSKLNGKLIV